jgi:hypothetical protein
MSIRSKTGQGGSVTDPWHAIAFFTDRYEAIRLFMSYLNDDPPRERILFFYGDGGNGKSLLLRFLRERCLWRLRIDDWADAQTTPDEQFVARLEQATDAALVPSALLDFGMQPHGDNQPQDVFYGLLMLRRELAQHGLRFPLFDYACVVYLHKTNQLSPERLSVANCPHRPTLLPLLLLLNTLHLL